MNGSELRHLCATIGIEKDGDTNQLKCRLIAYHELKSQDEGEKMHNSRSTIFFTLFRTPIAAIAHLLSLLAGTSLAVFVMG